MLRQMEWGVQDDYFSFAKILFQFKNLEWRVDLMY